MFLLSRKKRLKKVIEEIKCYILDNVFFLEKKIESVCYRCTLNGFFIIKYRFSIKKSLINDDDNYYDQ